MTRTRASIGAYEVPWPKPTWQERMMKVVTDPLLIMTVMVPLSVIASGGKRSSLLFAGYVFQFTGLALLGSSFIR